MRRGLTLAGIGVAAGVALVWGLGGFEALARMAAEAQRALQAPLAGAVRAVQAGSLRPGSGCWRCVSVMGWSMRRGRGMGNS
jgi:nickel/cobalt transporter (NicO) family protein